MVLNESKQQVKTIKVKKQNKKLKLIIWELVITNK